MYSNFQIPLPQISLPKLVPAPAVAPPSNKRNQEDLPLEFVMEQFDEMRRNQAERRNNLSGKLQRIEETKGSVQPLPLIKDLPPTREEAAHVAIQTCFKGLKILCTNPEYYIKPVSPNLGDMLISNLMYCQMITLTKTITAAASKLSDSMIKQQLTHWFFFYNSLCCDSPVTIPMEFVETLPGFQANAQMPLHATVKAYIQLSFQGCHFYVYDILLSHFVRFLLTDRERMKDFIDFMHSKVFDKNFYVVFQTPSSQATIDGRNILEKVKGNESALESFVMKSQPLEGYLSNSALYFNTTACETLSEKQYQWQKRFENFHRSYLSLAIGPAENLQAFLLTTDPFTACPFTQPQLSGFSYLLIVLSRNKMFKLTFQLYTKEGACQISPRFEVLDGLIHSLSAITMHDFHYGVVQYALTQLPRGDNPSLSSSKNPLRFFGIPIRWHAALPSGTLITGVVCFQDVLNAYKEDKKGIPLLFQNSYRTANLPAQPKAS